jgi:hypothetical protein
VTWDDEDLGGTVAASKGPPEVWQRPAPVIAAWCASSSARHVAGFMEGYPPAQRLRLVELGSRRRSGGDGGLIANNRRNGPTTRGAAPERERPRPSLTCLDPNVDPTGAIRDGTDKDE